MRVLLGCGILGNMESEIVIDNEPRADQQSSVCRYAAVVAKAVVLALLVFLVYFGGYLAFLDRKVYRQVGVDAATSINLFEIEPKYLIEGGAVEFAFAPAHEVDRMIRRGYWETIEKSNGMKWKNPRPAAE